MHIIFICSQFFWQYIGSHNYQWMKDAIGNLVPLFCKQIKIAMVTFSTDINLEFHFECFKNIYYEGREKARNAILWSNYHSATTNIGATTKHVCEKLISPIPGIPSRGSLVQYSDQNWTIHQTVKLVIKILIIKIPRPS